MTTANKLTILRMLLVPVFMVLMLVDLPVTEIIALAVFIIASITDSIDGYIARNYNQITDFGKFMDPLADKLLVTAAIIIFVSWNQMPAWAAMIILAREFAVTGLRMVAASSGTVIAAAKSGKIKTFSSIVAICIMLTPLRDVTVLVEGFTINSICILVMLITTVWSGVEYFVKNYKALDPRK